MHDEITSCKVTTFEAGNVCEEAPLFSIQITKIGYVSKPAKSTTSRSDVAAAVSRRRITKITSRIFGFSRS